MSPPSLRPATVEDLTALAPRLASLPLFTAYGMDAARLASRWTDGLRKGDRLRVAEVDGRLVGMSWSLSRGVFGTGGYLRTLAVAPEAQGQGLGLLLLQDFEARCDQPSGGWFLLTSDFNEGAQRFYRRHGYSEVGRMPPGFASPRIAELIFWKPAPRAPPG